MSDRTADMIRLMETGFNPFPGALPDKHSPQGLARIRRVWEQVKHELLERWIERYPGTRPWAWWKFSAPADRRERTDGGVHPFDDPEHHERAKAIKDQYGEQGIDILAMSDHKTPQYRGGKHARAKYETQREYLERHGLLTVDEQIALNNAGGNVWAGVN